MTTEATRATSHEPLNLQTGASIEGRAASLDEAIAAAAAILTRSHQCVVAGLGTDALGAAEALSLSRAIGAAGDHMRGDAALRDLDVMRQAGWIVTTPLQVRARADAVLLVGSGHEAIWPDMHVRLGLDAPPPIGNGQARTVLRLGEAEADTSMVPQLLGILRAIVGGRPVRAGRTQVNALQDLATKLTGARFGVAIWSADYLDPPSIEMLCGLIDDLNRKTRFAGLPLASGDNAAGAIAPTTSATGFPLRVSLARDAPAHDPWRFDAVRMVESGEADAAVWISALSATAPPWQGSIPTIALAPSGTRFGGTPAVAFAVGRPGVDHDATLFDQTLGTVAFVAATAPTDAPRVADVLARLNAVLASAAGIS